MAQQRQSGGSFFDKVGFGNDHVSVGIRAATASHNHNFKQSRTTHHRRFRSRRISVRAFVLVVLTLIFMISASAFFFLSKDDKDKDDYIVETDEFGTDLDFLANVTRTERSKILKFGHGLVGHGRDSRYWDRDDRRRDEDYGEDLVGHSEIGAQGGSLTNLSTPSKINDREKRFSEENKRSDHRVAGLYNEAGRNELKMYEAEYEASLKVVSVSKKEAKSINQQPDDTDKQKHDEEDDLDDEYNDEIDMHDIRLEDYNAGLGNDHNSDIGVSQGVDGGGSSTKNDDDMPIKDVTHTLLVDPLDPDKLKINSGHVSVIDVQSSRRAISERRIASKKRSKRRKYSGACEMKILNSTMKLVEPPENRKFARFSLEYTELEENINKLEPWKLKFAGNQNLEQREQSFVAHDQTLHCGFVKGPKGYPSTGFDLAEDDVTYISSCHIAVISCIFGNSDRLRSPMGKTLKQLDPRRVRDLRAVKHPDLVLDIGHGVDGVKGLRNHQADYHDDLRKQVPNPSAGGKQIHLSIYSFNLQTRRKIIPACLLCKVEKIYSNKELKKNRAREDVKSNTAPFMNPKLNHFHLVAEDVLVSRYSRKNVCFVMFVDDVTLQTLSSEGHMPDRMGYIGIWRIVNVKNLPYTDMRRVGKIPKLLAHRLFRNARYSIWLDSKLRLQLDPLLVLEYFLWRKGHEYAISNHYDRHCVWEEVAQNKKLNKYNHTVIDEQFAFYQADGLTRFNPMDSQKLLPSSRDCERRKIAKLFRHRSEERRYTVGQETE
ncbi:Protein of unknown function DUF616 [Cynara cardunculus var. scolymus]|uniref:TOD1/MUCI70 glycosyltransferase-like domain-containing protein n=1 Tax=Cynara cardunculus var. scolymus TaxID=59895 RepID=A0A118JSH3_CYNCS|nr:Protein of unknown function DUF616 [Cynara cardunculus var. scolymus]